MTVPSEINRSGPYNGNGVTTVFDYDFRILSDQHLRVIRADANGVETTLTLTTDYSVSGVGDAGGGSITTVSAPASGATITILRNMPFTQETDLENQGAYYAETVEDALDAAAMRDQQLAEMLDRAVLVPSSEDSSGGELAAQLAKDITRLAKSADEIDTVASIDTEVQTVAGISGDVALLADVSEVLSGTASAVRVTPFVFVGDGVKTDWTLPRTPGAEANVIMFRGGSPQIPGTDFTVSGETLTISPAVENGIKIFGYIPTLVTANDIEQMRDETEEARDAALAAVSRVDATFASLAALKAYTPLLVGQIVRTLGYFSKGDGGGNDYEIVAAGTGTDDGGSYVNLTASGLQAKGIFKGRVVDAEKFGAVDGVEASAALQAANNYAMSLVFNVADVPGNRSRLLLKMASAILIKNAITLGNVSAYNLDIDFSGAMISCVSGGNLTASTPALSIYGTSSIRKLCRVNCNKISSGYEFFNSANSESYGCFARRIASDVNAFGVRDTGTNRGHIIFKMVATEWEASDSEANTTTAYKATGLVFNGQDSISIGGHPGFCGIAIKFTANALLVHCVQPHPYCNNPANQAAFPRINPIAILNESANRNFIVDAYIDSGYVVDTTDYLQFNGSMTFVSTEASPGLSSPYVRIKSGGARRFTAVGFDTTFGYYDTDYTVVNSTGVTFTNGFGLANNGRSANMYRQRQQFFNNETSLTPHMIDAVLGGAECRYRLLFTPVTTSPASNGQYYDEIVRVTSGSIVKEMRLKRLWINGGLAEPTAESQSALVLGGGGNTGVKVDDNTGSIIFFRGGANKWVINGTTDALIPNVDAESGSGYSIGAASFRVRDVFTFNSPTVGSDARYKQDNAPIPDAVLDAWGEVGFEQYKMRNSVAEKGVAARLHTGLVAQKVEAVFAERGLDASEYGLLCFDKWEATEEREAGEGYSIRYDEALCVEAAYQRRRADLFEARLAALEAAIAK